MAGEKDPDPVSAEDDGNSTTSPLSDVALASSRSLPPSNTNKLSRLCPGLDTDDLHQVREHAVGVLPTGDDARGLQCGRDVEALTLMADAATGRYRRGLAGCDGGSRKQGRVFAIEPGDLGRGAPLVIGRPRAGEIPTRQPALLVGEAE